MNKSYKVVFSKARSAFMVVNECTKSVQAKGTKTVVAALSAALITGAAAASEKAGAAWVTPPTGEDVYLVENQGGDASSLKQQNVFSMTNGGRESFLNFKENASLNADLWVIGSKSNSAATGIWAGAYGVEAVNAGKIYVASQEGANVYSQAAMKANNGGTVVNEGVIVAKNAYGMGFGTDSTPEAPSSQVMNRGLISVLESGVGIDLGGTTAQNAAINDEKGLITAEGSSAAGVLIDQAGGIFTNAGKIDASKAAAAILVTEKADGSVINLTSASDIDGVIDIAANSGVALNLAGTKDTLKLKSAAGSNLTINVTDGAHVTLEDGNGAEIQTLNVENGMLSASIWQADNKFNSVAVKKDGIFDVTKLNAGGDKADLASKPHDTLLLAFGSGLTLDGGKLYQDGKLFTGKLKVGANTQGNGGLRVQNGSALSLERLEVGTNGSVSIEDGGSITTENLHISKGGLAVKKGGQLSVTDAMTFYDSITSDGKKAKLHVHGVLSTDGKNVFVNEGSAEAPSWSVSEAWSQHVQGDGILEITNDVGEYTLDALRIAQGHLNKEGDSFHLVFKNGTLKLEGDKALAAGQVEGLMLADQTGQAADGSFALSGKVDTVLAAVDFGGKESAAGAVTISSAGEGALVLSGHDGNVFKGLAETTQKVTADALTLGTSASSVGSLNVAELEVENLDVVGSFTGQTVTLKDAGSTVKEGGRLSLETLDGGVDHVMTVNGILAATNISAGVSVEEGGVLALNAAGDKDAGVTGLITIGSGAANLLRTDSQSAPALSFGGTNERAAEIVAGSLDAASDLAGVTGVFYADRAVKIGSRGQINVGAALGANNALTIGQNGALVVDARSLGADALINGQIAFDEGAKAFAVNLNRIGNFVLADGGALQSEKTFQSDNAFLTAQAGKLDGQAETDDKTYLKVAFNKDAVGSGNEKLASLMEQGFGNARNGDVFRAVGQHAAYFDEDAQSLTDLGASALKEYMAAPVTAGTYNAAYDAAEQVSGAIMQRNARSEGQGIWADVLYASNKAKSLYGGTGYSADIYGGVLGFDAAFAGGAKLGAAFTIGKADAGSERTLNAFKNKADFYGLSLYTGKNVADTSLYIGADLSYLWIDNDLTGSVAGASAAESLDSSVLTIGLRADWTAYEGVVNVIPHVGIRYAAIDVDDYRGFKSDSLHVLEMPIGVKVAGAIEPAAGWKLVPSADFTITPQVGGKSVGTVLGDVDVVGNLYSTTLGVEAVSGNFSFGLSAGYGFGNADRENATLKANVRYAF